jgi:phosphoribosylaminoimidazolecarboxamide formyltransferase/IMP cyclohydrolase
MGRQAGTKEAIMTINVVEKIDGPVKVRHVIVSVSDKRGLEKFIPALLDINPEIKFFSTGGTYGKISEILGEKASRCLTPVSDYTGQPETQGGLVKTLDFKISQRRTMRPTREISGGPGPFPSTWLW